MPPIAVIGGSKTGLAHPSGIALDASGEIYVANIGGYPKGNITVYPPLGTSAGILNEPPIATIAGSKTLLDAPTGIAVDDQGRIYAANELGGPRVRGAPSDRGRVSVYAAGSNGNVAPIATISGARTGLAYPLGIALDSDGDIYAANFYTANTNSKLQNNASITVYAAGSEGDAQPIASIAGSNAELGIPWGITLDSRGNVYIAGYVYGVGNTINVYPAGSNGNVSPAASIAGADTELNDPTALALDASGSLYVSNSFGGPADAGSITVYPTGSSGDTAPVRTISSKFNGLDFASAIAVDSAGKIYVANELGGASKSGTVAVYSPGSYAAGPPNATIAGDNTGLYHPVGIGLDASGNIAVLNSNNTVTEYPTGSAGNAAPNTTINVDSNGEDLATGMAVAPGGKIYIANQALVSCNEQHSCYPKNLGSVAVYRAGGAGNAKPSTVIGGPDTGLAFPSAVAVDRRGEVYVANEGLQKCPRYCSCFPIGPASVTAYAPDSNGDVGPIATISGSNTQLEFPNGIALDSRGNIYVLSYLRGPEEACFILLGGGFIIGRADPGNSSGDPILVFAAGSDGDTAPIAVIGGAFTGLSGAGIAIGPSPP